jgi:hypothetical protein
VILVVGIIGFAMVSLLVLVAMGVETNKVSAEESGAVSLASEILDDLRSTPSRDAGGLWTAASKRHGLRMPLALQAPATDVLALVDVDGQTGPAARGVHYRVQLAYEPAGHTSNPPTRGPAYVSLRILWPAEAAGTAAYDGQWECVASFPVEGAGWK